MSLYAYRHGLKSTLLFKPFTLRKRNKGSQTWPLRQMTNTLLSITLLYIVIISQKTVSDDHGGLPLCASNCQQSITNHYRDT